MSKIAVVEPLVVNVSPKTNWTFVAVSTRDGHTGWGECSLNRWEPLLTASLVMLSRDIVGATFEAAFDAIRYLPHSPGGLVMHAAKSALEQALTDVLAQQSGLPIHEEIGGARRDAVPAYANINRGIATRSPEGFAEAARAAVAAGYRNIKIAPFDGVIAEDAASTPIDARIKAGLDRVYRGTRRDRPRSRADGRLSLAVRRAARHRADTRYRGGVPVLGRMSDFRASVAIWRDRATTGSRT